MSEVDFCGWLIGSVGDHALLSSSLMHRRNYFLTEPKCQTILWSLTPELSIAVVLKAGGFGSLESKLVPKQFPEFPWRAVKGKGPAAAAKDEVLQLWDTAALGCHVPWWDFWSLPRAVVLIKMPILAPTSSLSLFPFIFPRKWPSPCTVFFKPWLHCALALFLHTVVIN